MSPTEATILINRRKAAVLDLRELEAYKAGHLPGAKHIDAAGLTAAIEKLKLDKNNPLILVCETGVQSRKATSEIKKLGFVEVASLDGGVQAWKAAALPLVK